MKYRKRPLVVEAWRFQPTLTDSEHSANLPPRWLMNALWLWPKTGGIKLEPDHKDGPRISIATLDSVAIASPGDYIVRGVHGELYPCKPTIFGETYEEVPEPSEEFIPGRR